MADDAATQPREPLAAEAPAEVEAAAAATATTEAEAGRAGEPIAVDDAVEQEQGQEHKSEEPQDVHPPVILLDEEDKEKAGVDPQHENAGTNDEIKEAEHDDNDDDVVMIEPPPPSTAVKAGGSPAKARSDALETEFQCVLCHDVLFKVRFLSSNSRHVRFRHTNLHACDVTVFTHSPRRSSAATRSGTTAGSLPSI